MWKHIEKHNPKLVHNSKCWFPFWKQLLGPFPLWRVLFASCFSEPLGCTSFDRCWPPLGHLWSDVVTFLENVGGSLLEVQKIPEQQMSPNTPSKTKLGLTTTLPMNNTSEPVSTFVKQNHVNLKPQFVLKVGRRNSRRDNDSSEQNLSFEKLNISKSVQDQIVRCPLVRKGIRTYLVLIRA